MFTPYGKDRFLSLRTGGRGTQNTADHWNDLRIRTDWIRTQQSRAGGWAHGASEGVVSAAAAATFDIATFQLPPLGRAEPVLRVYLVLTVTSGSAEYLARLTRQSSFTPDEDLSAEPLPEFFVFGDSAGKTQWTNSATLATATSLTASGTYYADLALTDYAFDPDVGLYGVDMVATATAAVSHQVDSVSVIAKPSTTLDAESVSSTWLKCSTAYAGLADRSDNVACLARLRNQQNIVAGRDPRVLALHCFRGTLTVAESNPSAYDSDFRDFVVARGHDAGNVTLAVYIATNTNGITVALGRADTMTFTSSTGVLSGSMASQSFASGTTGWQTITVAAAGWTANAFVTLRLLAYQNAIETSAGTITAFALFEAERTEADYKASDSTMPAALVEQDYFRAGGPIVADWSAGTQTRRDDRKTSADNLQLLAWRNSQCLAQDYLDAPTAYAGTSAALGTVLWRGYVVTSALGTGLTLNARVRRDITETNRRPILALYVAGSEVARLDPGGFGTFGTVAEWFNGLAATLSASTAYEIDLRGGWVDLSGNAAASAGDKLYLEGVRLAESR